MEKKKITILTMTIIITLVLALGGATYAYFRAQGDLFVSRDARVHTHSTDLFTFNIHRDIKIDADEYNFARNEDSLIGETTATATLKANSSTKEADEKYNLFINIESNPFVLSGTHGVDLDTYSYKLTIPGYENETFNDLNSNQATIDRLRDILYEAGFMYGYNERANYNQKSHIEYIDINSVKDYSFTQLSYKPSYGVEYIKSRVDSNIYHRKENFFVEHCEFIVNTNSSLCEKDYYNNTYIDNDANLSYYLSLGQSYYDDEEQALLDAGYLIISNNKYKSIADNFTTEYDYVPISELIQAGYIRPTHFSNCVFTDDGDSVCLDDYKNQNGIIDWNSFDTNYKQLLVDKGYIDANSSYTFHNEYTFFGAGTLHDTKLHTDYLKLFMDTGYLQKVRDTETILGDPELILQVIPPQGITLNSIPGLEYKTVTDGQGVEISGYDITTKEGIVSIASKLPIEVTTENVSGITQHEWTIRIILVNLDQDQSVNTNKKLLAKVVMTKEAKPTLINGLLYTNIVEQLNPGVSVVPNDAIYCIVGDDYNSCVNQDYYISSDDCENRIVRDIDKGFISEGEYSCQPQYEIYCAVVDGIEYCSDRDFYTNVNQCEFDVHDAIDEGFIASGECVVQNVSYLNIGGIGEYSLRPYLNEVYDVYCPIGADNQTCTANWYYNSLEWCENNVDTNIYTCTPWSVAKPVYLKHNVENNIIQSTEVCLYYNNHELCIEPNYWIGDDQDLIDGSSTKTKLETQMETVFETSVDMCDSWSHDTWCRFEDVGCTINASGNVNCSGIGFTCGVNGDGSSYCETY